MFQFNCRVDNMILKNNNEFVRIENEATTCEFWRDYLVIAGPQVKVYHPPKKRCIVTIPKHCFKILVDDDKQEILLLSNGLLTRVDLILKIGLGNQVYWIPLIFNKQFGI